MLNKFLVICSLSLCSFVGLQAHEENFHAQQIDLNKEVTQILACGKGKHKHKGDLACGKGEHKHKGDLACGKHKHKGDLACGKSKHKNKGDLACGKGKHKHKGDLACGKGKHKNKGDLACGKGHKGKGHKEKDNALFALFCDDDQNEENLLACNNC